MKWIKINSVENLPEICADTYYLTYSKDADEFNFCNYFFVEPHIGWSDHWGIEHWPSEYFNLPITEFPEGL